MARQRSASKKASFAGNGHSEQLNGPIAAILEKLGYSGAAAAVRGADYSVYAQWEQAGHCSPGGNGNAMPNGNGSESARCVFFKKLGLDGALPQSRCAFLDEEPDDYSPHLRRGLVKLCENGPETVRSAAELEADDIPPPLFSHSPNFFYFP